MFHRAALSSGARADRFASRGNSACWLEPYTDDGMRTMIKKLCREPADEGIFSNEASITRLVGAIFLEQNDEWAVQRAR